jgi:RNA polymerase sigma-70 factor (ECF subfamily)
VDARNDALSAAVSRLTDLEIDEAFREHYGRLARLIARVVGDRARAEELAVDAFLKWWRRTGARGAGAGKWLYRVAVRLAIDELRRDARRARYVRIAPVANPPATPEDVQAAEEEQRRVRAVLATLSRRDAALLLLRSEGLAYQELAAALGLNPASVGTFIGRAQRAFRTEYVRRYGP